MRKCLRSQSYFCIIGKAAIRNFPMLRWIYTNSSRFRNIRTDFIQEVSTRNQVLLARINRNCDFNIDQRTWRPFFHMERCTVLAAWKSTRIFTVAQKKVNEKAVSASWERTNTETLTKMEQRSICRARHEGQRKWTDHWCNRLFECLKLKEENARRSLRIPVAKG